MAYINRGETGHPTKCKGCETPIAFGLDGELTHTWYWLLLRSNVMNTPFILKFHRIENITNLKSHPPLFCSIDCAGKIHPKLVKRLILEEIKEDEHQG